MTEPLSLLAMLVIGLLGSGHCVGMCGGIASGLGFASSGKVASAENVGSAENIASERTRGPQLVLGYNLGRILSYGLAGVLVASLGYWGREFLALGPVLRILAGVILVLMGLYLAGWWNILVYLERAGAGLWRRLQPLGRPLLPVRGVGQAVLLGMLWGWLPCGLVYTALAYAATAQSPAQGGLMMVFFGLGTAPAMVAGGLFSARIRQLLQGRHLRQLMALAMIAFGVWTLASVAIHSGHDGANSGNTGHGQLHTEGGHNHGASGP